MPSLTPTGSELRERVAIQSSSTTTDAQLGRPKTWTVLDTVAAKVDSAGDASEGQQVGGITASAKHIVTIRYRSDVTAKMRLRWRGMTLQIHSVVVDPRRAWLTLQCGEVQG